MKESTGAVSAIYVVIFFVIIMFGFIISTLSYYKSYKINNSLTAAIEDYGGFNSYSMEEIEKRLTSYGYTRSDKGCSISDNDFNNNRVRLVKADGSIINDSKSASTDELGYRGYCVYIVNDKSSDTAVDYEYYSYKVTTSMTFDFGLFDVNVPIKISSHTSTMYSCYNSSLNC